MFVEQYEIPIAPQKADPFTIVFFSGAGDLPEWFVILGAGVPAMSDEAYRELMAEACRARLGWDCPAGSWGPAAAEELLGREGRRWLTQ